MSKKVKTNNKCYFYLKYNGWKPWNGYFESLQYATVEALQVLKLG